MSFLKPKAAKSSSENTNNALLTSTYTPQMQQGVGASNFLGNLLGVSGGAVSSAANSIGTAANGLAEAGGAQAGYNNYLQNAGYQPAMTNLARGVTGQGAAAGLLNSGATTQSLQRKGTELNQGFFNNYLQQLAGLSGLGLQAGSQVANAGQKSTSTGGGPSTLGSIASAAGGIASIFSDQRLKRDIEKTGEYPDGLGKYKYRYMWDLPGTVRHGVMADEVSQLRPWALGPKIFGYLTVRYEAL